MQRPDSQKLISAVVIARNEAATLGRCLAAARRALDARGGGEILVVDSASTDSTVRVGVESGYRVLAVRKSSRMCPSAMRRLGASRTESRYVLFLDGDCELEQEFLPAALEAMEADPALGVVAGRRRDFYRTGQTLVPADGEYYRGQAASSAAHVPAYGGCALYRRRALDGAGSFDPFLRAKEEEDLAQRIRAAGYRITVMDVPMIRHMTVPRESARRLLRSIRHGFYVGRGQAARVFLSRGEVRSAFRGLDRVLLTMLHLVMGGLCLWGAWNGVAWPLLTWFTLSLATFCVFVVRTRSLSRAVFYVLEWIVQGACLVFGILTPRRSPDSFKWEGDELAPEPADSSCLPGVLLAGPLPAPPFRGGVEKGVSLLLQGDLRRRTSMRHFNTYRAPDPSRSLLSRVSYQAGMIRRFRKELKARPLDLVHLKTSSGVNFHQNALYALVARMSGVPVLLQLHSGRFETFYRGSIAPMRAWIRSSLSTATRLAVLSRSWAERIATIAPNAEVRVVPNGLGEEEAVSLGDGGEIRPSQVLFLGTGRDHLNRDKGLEDLLSVLPDLVHRHPQSRWVLAGLEDAEATRARLRAHRIETAGKEGRVSCRGLVEDPEKRDLLKTSAILVLPSYFENMPNVLLEGMAAGLGIVATDVGAIPEMLGYGEGGLVISPGDRGALASALDRLLGSPALIRTQGRRNRSVVAREYSMSVVHARLEALYLEVAGWQVAGGASDSPPVSAMATEAGHGAPSPVRPVSEA